MARAVSLNIYRIVENDGTALDQLKDILADKDINIFQPTIESDFECLLYVTRSESRRPEWIKFLEEGFGTIDLVDENSAHGALMLVRSPEKRLFAFCFGQGRHLLRPGTYEQNYGLRVVVNLLSQPVDPAVSRSAGAVRSVDAKTVATNILHTRRQSDRRASFEAFGVDTNADLVRAITGHPLEATAWGTRVTGGDSIRISRQLQFSGLGALLDTIEEMARQDLYKTDYGWIDNVRAVIDPAMKEGLIAQLIESLRNDGNENIDLTPPDLIDWDEEIVFELSTVPGKYVNEVQISQYLNSIDRKDLSLEKLKADSLFARDEAGESKERWSVFRSITGEIEYQGNTYIISDGNFYEVSKSFRENLDAYLMQLPEAAIVLPDWVGHAEEKEYNREAAKDSNDQLLLMDRKNIKVSSSTSAIELCDLLTRDKKLVHVKPKSGSATLSHLFAQGFVSGDLLLMSQEFRKRALEKITEAEQEAGYPPGEFACFEVEGIVAREYEIIFAIAGDWHRGAALTLLPFFSKINLRRTAQELRRMGYQISYKLVDRT